MIKFFLMFLLVIGLGVGMGDGQAITPASSEFAVITPENVANLEIISTFSVIDPLAIALHPDGSLLAIAHVGGVTLFDLVDSDAEPRLLEEHADHVTAVVFNGDGSLMVTGSVDKTVRVWDVETGESVQVFSLEEEETITTIRSVAISPDDSLIVASDTSMYLWSTETGERLEGFVMMQETTANELAFSAEGEILVAGTADGRLRTWTLADGEQILDVGRLGRVNAMNLNGDGTQVAVASQFLNRVAQVIDLETGEEVVLFKMPNDPSGLGVAFSPDGSFVAVTVQRLGESLAFFDVQTGDAIVIMDSTYPAYPSRVYFSTDGTAIITAPLISVTNFEKTVFVWRVRQ